MANTNEVVTASVGIALFLILVSGVVMPSYDKAQGIYDYEDVDTTAEWENAILSGSSTDYSVSNDTVTLTSSSATVVTDNISTDDHDTLTVDASHLSGDLTVTLYDEQDNSVTSKSTTGDTDVTLDVSNYTSSNYHLEWTSSTTSDAEIDSYAVTGETSRDSTIQAFLLIAMLLFVIGIAVKFY